MSNNDDFWKNINDLQKWTNNFRESIFPKGSPSRNLMDQSTDLRKQMDKIVPKTNDWYKNLLNDPSKIKALAKTKIPTDKQLKKSMELIREINTQKSHSNFDYYQKITREVFDNMHKVNNFDVSSQLNQVSKQFGYPGANLNKTQQENVNRFNSDFVSNESDNSFSESPNIPAYGANRDNLNSSSHSKDTSNVISKENMENVPAKEKEVSDEQNVINDAIKQKISYMLRNKVFNQTNVPLWTFIFSLFGNSIDLPNESLEVFILHCLDDTCAALVTYYGSKNIK